MKLKLGDIEMDSEGGISFGESAAPAVAAQEQAQSVQRQPEFESESDDASLIERLPDWSRKTYLLAALLAAAGAIALGAVGAGLGEAYGAMRVVPLIPVPGLLVAAGVALWQAARTRADSPSMDALARERSDTIAGHLSGRGAPASVEELMDELGWREEAVVRGLSAGVDRSCAALATSAFRITSTLIVCQSERWLRLCFLPSLRACLGVSARWTESRSLAFSNFDVWK